MSQPGSALCPQTLKDTKQYYSAAVPHGLVMAAHGYSHKLSSGCLTVCCHPAAGCICCMQFVREFAKLGLTRSVGGVLALALARELTPVVTAIILAGRVGSAFAAELGTMQVCASHG